MHNLLNNWKKECYLLSSPLAIKKQLERKDVDTIYQILNGYFGVEYFNIETSETIPETKSNWLHFLLVNHKRPACIAALYEIANILIYLQTLSKSLQNKFKTLFQDPRQFRDMFFELYIFRLLDYNGITNTKKAKEGKKELDVLCTIERQEYLCECRKIYAPNINLIDAEKYLLEKLYLKLPTLNKVFGLIGTIKFNNPNDEKIKDVFESKIIKFINWVNGQKNITDIQYNDIDEFGELLVIKYDLATSIEIDNNLSKYHVVFKIIPPHNPIPTGENYYQIDLKSNCMIQQSKVTNKVLSTLGEKHDQHLNSKYIKKIYFIDSETIPDFSLPIFRLDSMFEEDKIQEYVNSLGENVIVCFIKREYMEEVPKVSIQAIGKDIDPVVKNCLENLKTNFDYKIMIN